MAAAPKKPSVQIGQVASKAGAANRNNQLKAAIAAGQGVGDPNLGAAILAGQGAFSGGGQASDPNQALTDYLNQLQQQQSAADASSNFQAAVAYGQQRADATDQLGLDRLSQQIATNQLGRTNQQYDIQTQGINAAQGEATRQAGLQSQGVKQAAAASGATTAVGTRTSLGAIGDTLAYTQGGYGRQLQDIQLGRAGAQDSYSQTYMSLTNAINSLLRTYPGIG